MLGHDDAIVEFYMDFHAGEGERHAAFYALPILRGGEYLLHLLCYSTSVQTAAESAGLAMNFFTDS